MNACTLEAAHVNALNHDLAIVKSKLAVSRVEGANSRRGTLSVAIGPNDLVEDASNALMTVSGEAIDATE